MKCSFIISAALLLIAIFAYADNTGSISGIIVDEVSNEPLIGANIVIADTRFGSAADLNGNYIINRIPAGEYIVKASMVGYTVSEKALIVIPGADLRIDFALKDTTVSIPDVVVSAERIVEGTSVSDVALTPRMLRSKDGLMQDPVKVIQTMPGIVSMGDLFAPSQLYVRGGSPEENMFLLDWAQVHWPWYSGGMKSIFNSDVIDRIELLTGGFPAKYGNCLSSVLSVTTRDGNRERYAGSFSTGIMTTQGLIEGPINKNSSFIITARRTYLDLLMGEDAEFPVPSFYDTNFKLMYEISRKHAINFTGFASYEGTDFYTAEPDPEAGMPSVLKTSDKLNTQSLGINSVFNPNLYSILTVTRSYGDYDIMVGSGWKMHLIAQIYGIREDVTFDVHPKHQVKTGFDLTHVDYNLDGIMPLDPSDLYTTYDSTGIRMGTFVTDEKFFRGGAYLQDTYQMLPQFSLTGGIRLDKHFWTEEMTTAPRLSARYELNRKTALRAAWGEYYMNIDPMYLDINEDPKSNKAIHYIVGINHDFNRTFSGWVEAYYKDYSNLLAGDSTGFYTNSGTGYSKGIELLLQKKLGALSGWFTYSLSEAKRREFLDAEEFYFDYDQRHNVSMVLEYHNPNPKKFVPDVIGLNARYASGRPYTRVISANQDNLNKWHPVKESTNASRYNDFNTVSMRLEWHFPLFGRARGKSYFELWNILNRKNDMGVEYRYSLDYASTNNVKAYPYYTTPFLFAGGFGIEF